MIAPDPSAGTTAVGPPRQVEAEPESVPQGPTLARYLVIGRVGSGGMAHVLRAYDPKLQREVALKTVRRNRYGTDLVHEARAMAKLSHPNVVSVYDVEPDEHGRVLLAMEYVEGSTLRGFLRDENARKTPREILDVLVAAGRGLAAAHGVSLLHRDFKPDNVLVGRDSAGTSPFGRVCVTDFGLAVAGTDPGSSTADPEDGSERDGAGSDRIVFGTPSYMAPEQHRGDPLDARADQFAFCVTAWEALVGKRPYAGDFRELAKAKHRLPPPWPREVAVPKAIGAAIRRGLMPRPEDRWPSMDVLLRQLVVHSSARRRAWAASLVAVGLVAGALGLELGASNNEPCRGARDRIAGIWDDDRREVVMQAIADTGAAYAQDVQAHVTRELDAYADAWVAMHTDACEATSVRAEQSTEVLDLRMGCLMHALWGLHAATDVLARGDAEVVERAHELVAGLPRVDRCGDIEMLRADVPPPDPEERDAVEQVRRRLATVRALSDAGEQREALAAFTDARAAGEPVRYQPLHAELDAMHGHLLHEDGAYEAAEQALLSALREAMRGDDWGDVLAVTTQLVYVCGVSRSEPQRALAFAEIGWGVLERLPSPVSEAALRSNVAMVRQNQGELALAETEQREALRLQEATLGADHPDTISTRSNLGTVLNARGRYAESEAEIRLAIAALERVLGPRHPSAASARNNLAHALYAQGRYAEAETELRDALDVWVEAYGAEHPDVAAVRGNLANALIAQGRSDAAEAELRTAIEIRRTHAGGDVGEAHAGSERINLGTLLQAQGRNEEAEGVYRAVIADLRRARIESSLLASAHSNLGMVLGALGRLEDAEVEYRTAIDLAAKLFDGQHPDLALMHLNLGELLRERGKKAEALAHLRESWRMAELVALAPEHRATVAFALAQALRQARTEPELARALAETARDRYAEAGSAYDATRREVETWLAR